MLDDLTIVIGGLILIMSVFVIGSILATTFDWE
jgi:hypothetical protein